MKVTVIVSVYKDVEALELILESLFSQTYKDFEILVSEDCQSDEMKIFLSRYNDRVKHISQEDNGWRKNIALNNAIRNATGDYLIFLDGDIIPYKNFVQMHIEQREENKFLSGRRSELGPFFSKLIRKKIIHFRWIENLYLPLLPFILLDRAKHAEEGIFFKPGSYLERKFNGKKKKDMMLVGCNFSCFKKDLEKINGFDEDYEGPSVGEDVDLSWRFAHFGITSKSVRYIANTFHLYHGRNWGSYFDENNRILDEKRARKEYFCKNGLLKKEKK